MATRKSKYSICILGGCAKMAVPALRELKNEKDVRAVCLADLDADKTDKLAEEYGDKFYGRAVNAMNHTELVELLREFDVAMGYIGPFYFFENRIIRACIEAKTNYVSIADDYDSYLAAEKLSDKAKDAGVTIISGLGNSPGITNILAKKGYLSMDTPEKINVHWTGGSDEDIGPANVKHVMHIFAGETLQWIDGKETWVKTGRGRKVVEFPEPIGIQPVYYTGHAESVSIPRNLKGLQEVTLHGGSQPKWVSVFARTVGELGLTTTHNKRELLTKALSPIMGLFSVGGTADKSVFRIDCYGKHKGKEKHNYYTGVGHIAEITSMPCVEGAMMLARGEIKQHGVFAAEAVFDPDDFLPRIAKRGVTMTYYDGVKEM